MKCSFHLSLDSRFIHPSICPSIHSSCNHPPICKSILQVNIHPPIHPSNHHPAILHAPTHSPISKSILHVYIHSSTHPSIHPPIHPKLSVISLVSHCLSGPGEHSEIKQVKSPHMSDILRVAWGDRSLRTRQEACAVGVRVRDGAAWQGRQQRVHTAGGENEWKIAALVVGESHLCPGPCLGVPPDCPSHLAHGLLLAGSPKVLMCPQTGACEEPAPPAVVQEEGGKWPSWWPQT